jgi:GNAT superfamily N-acetyltransferase
METADIILRHIRLGDIARAMKLSTDEGWNQTEKDLKILIENSNNICILAEHYQKIIGTTTAINYSNQIAWLGMVLVDKEYRGQGISKMLLTNVFKEIESFRSIKLDATPEGRKVYKKFGFEDEHIIYRMTIDSMNDLSYNDGISTETIEENSIEEIIFLDATAFGANRKQLIESLIKQYPQKGWLLKKNDHITGFALGRDGNKYHQIGPVVASSTADAKALITQAIKKLINQPIVVDVLSDKKDLNNWLSSIGFTTQRIFTRMYKKENPFPGTIEKQYLICGPEFG